MLVDRINESGWKLTNLRVSNTSGSLLDASSMETSVPSMDADVIPDEYTLVASNVTGDVADITISTLAPNNPYNGRVVTGVDVSFLQDTTVLPGVVLEFNGTVANGDTSVIKVGVFGGTIQAGGATAGVGTGAVRHQVENDGAEPVTLCKARLLTQVIVFPKTNLVFLSARPYAESATEKFDPATTQTQPYVVSISGVSGSGAGKICDLSVDGDVLGEGTVYDINDDDYFSGTGLSADGSRPYRIVDGPLTDWEFVIHPDVANGDEANVLVFPPRHLQIAPDVAGVAGQYGTADVTLTESGEDDGVISPSGVAYYWSRFLVAEGAGGQSNPHPTLVFLEGLEDEAGSANWSA